MNKTTRIAFSVLLPFICFTMLSGAQTLIKPGDIVLQPDFNREADRALWTAAPYAEWVTEEVIGRTVARFTVSPEQAGNAAMTGIKLDLSPYLGMKLGFTCLAKAANVSKPPQPYLGVKFMLHYKSQNDQAWINQNDVYGTFDWKELSFSAVIPDSPVEASLSMGLQGSSGTAWFDRITIVVLKTPPPKPLASKDRPPAYTGHDLPRLRGVMSPGVFREEDMRILGKEWKANLIRWQLVRAWGKPNTDRDPAEYDQWIDEKCDELDKALDACRRYGIKLVIDLHSPPGGRYEDNSMAMFYEKEYNDHFIRVWERLAKRFHGHPALWAYDLVNEPVQNKPPAAGLDFLETQTSAAKAIRSIDPATAIIIEAEEWDSPQGFRFLTPVDVPNTVYQVHMYVPGEFTHQGVYDKAAGIGYPGVIGGKKFDKSALREVLKPVLDFQLAYNVHIYVGEFSAIRWAPGAATYLMDCIDIFEGYGWDWSYHAYREWPGWSVEYENQKADKIAVKSTDRKKILLYWFSKNKKPR